MLTSRPIIYKIENNLSKLVSKMTLEIEVSSSYKNNN